MRPKLRKLLFFTLGYAVVVGACLSYSWHQRDIAEELEVARLDGRDADYEEAVSASRRAGFGVAIASLLSLSYLLVLGVALAPSPLRLISGNLLVLVCLFLLLELASRLFGLYSPAIGRPGIAGDFGLWVYDAKLGWYHAPATTARRDLGGPDRGDVRINSLGLRGAEVQPETHGHMRVLVFGDSYVFGVGVDEKHLLSTRLETLFRKAFPEGVEVINMGVSGYSTDQEILLYEELGARLDPDIVILVLCDNDYLGNTENFAWRQYYKPYFDIDDDGTLTLRNVPVPRLTTLQRVKLWLGRESNVWNFVRNRESEHPWVSAFLGWFQVDLSRPPRRPYKLTRAIVSEFARRVRESGARFVVVSTGRRGESPVPFAGLSSQLEQEGVLNVDLLPVLENAREREPNRYWDFPGDTHWNRDAHELAAETIFQYLVEQEVVSPLVMERHR